MKAKRSEALQSFIDLHKPKKEKQTVKSTMVDFYRNYYKNLRNK